MARRQDESLLSSYAKPYPPKPSSRELRAIKDFLNPPKRKKYYEDQKLYDEWERMNEDETKAEVFWGERPPSATEGITSQRNPLWKLLRMMNPYYTIKDRLNN